MADEALDFRLRRRPESIRINEQTADIVEWREAKEFFTPDARYFQEPAPIPLTVGDAMLGKLMLVVCELAEAAEEVRAGEYEKFGVECADTVIRLMDICGTGGIDLAALIQAKMEKNWLRPVKHGKKTNL